MKNRVTFEELLPEIMKQKSGGKPEEQARRLVKTMKKASVNNAHFQDLVVEFVVYLWRDMRNGKI